MTDVEQRWYTRDVLLKLDRFTAELLTAAGFQIEGLAKANIVANDQIDTGFMLNSVYSVAPGKDSYSAALSAAQARNPAAVMGPRQQPPDEKTAVVAVGASYAVYDEKRNSFLYRAVEQFVKMAGGVIETVARKVGLR